MLATRPDYTPEWIKAKLAANPVMVERSLIVLWERQTATEQATGAALENNGVGFSGCDAEILSSFAVQVQTNPRQYPEGSRLSPKQRELARRKLAKYARQLSNIANAR